MSIIAFARTTPGDGPGILISDYDPESDVHTGLATIDGEIALTEDGDLDTGNADALLEAGGWSRAGAWECSGGQWAAPAERSENSRPATGPGILAELNRCGAGRGYNWQNG